MQRPPPEPDAQSRWLTPARVAGLLILAAGVLGVHATIDLLTAAVGRAELSRTGYAAGLMLALAVILPPMAGGLYLIHKGRIEETP